MNRVQPGKFLGELFDIYARAGGVVEYVLFAEQNRTTTPAAKHLKAANMALNIIYQKDRITYPGMAFRLSTHPEKARFWQVGYDQFIGSEPYAPSDEADGADNRVGYRAVFTSPPYGISLTAKETNGLFEAINYQLFEGQGDSLRIYRWSTDWSNYYEAGHEWWGAYHWTIEVPCADLLVSLSASTTD